MQWALTSYNAPYILNVQTYEIAKGQTDFSFNLTEYFTKFTPGMKYYVYAVGINDNTGSKQLSPNSKAYAARTYETGSRGNRYRYRCSGRS